MGLGDLDLLQDEFEICLTRFTMVPSKNFVPKIGSHRKDRKERKVIWTEGRGG